MTSTALRPLLLPLLTTLLLSACVSMPAPTVNVRELDLPKAAVPTRQDWIDGQRVKVIVMPPDGAEFAEAQRAQLTPMLAKGVEATVEESGAEAIDRSLGNKLRDEARLAEAKGVEGFEGPAVAHFAVRSSFDKVSVNSLREEKSLMSKLMFKKNEPPSYKHTVTVEGSVRVHEIPSMNLVKTLRFKEVWSDENESPRLQGPEDRVRATFEKAFNRVRTDLKNLVAPRGAVLKKGVIEGVTLYQVALGQEHGVQNGSKVRIVATSRPGGEENTVAEGVVTHNITARSAWITIEDAQAAAKVREGHLARVVFDDGLLGVIKNW